MMRHAAIEAKGVQNTPAEHEEKKAIQNADETLNTNDLNYKYTVCLMKCCPCLRPETEEEIEAKHAGKHAPGKQLTFRQCSRGTLLISVDCVPYEHASLL